MQVSTSFRFYIDTIARIVAVSRECYFYSQWGGGGRKKVKFEIHYLIKLKEMNAESNVMEGLKGSAEGANDNSTSRRSFVARRKTYPVVRLYIHAHLCIYVRIGTAANLNADRGLNAVDVRTHESPDSACGGHISPAPVLETRLSLSYRFPALMPPLGF